MEGLTYKFKTADTIAEKLSERTILKGKLYSELAESMNDILRYTIIFPNKDYTLSTTKALAELVNQGYKKVGKLNNGWGRAKGYKGLNATFETADGFKFEVQFHTPQSFYTKQTLTHELYERQRVLPFNSSEWRELSRQMNNFFKEVSIPDGASLIK